MHVVVLFRYFWPESRVSEEPHMLREIVHRHVARGDAVDVICGSADDCREAWAREFPERVSVSSFQAPVDRNGPLLGRVLNSARLLLRGLGTLLWPRRIDLLYLFTYPPGFAGAMIAFCRVFRRRTRILFSFQDNLGDPLQLSHEEENTYDVDPISQDREPKPRPNGRPDLNPLTELL